MNKLIALAFGLMCTAIFSHSAVAASYYYSQYPGYVLKCDNYSCYYTYDTGYSATYSYSYPTVTPTVYNYPTVTPSVYSYPSVVTPASSYYNTYPYNYYPSYYNTPGLGYSFQYGR